MRCEDVQDQASPWLDNELTGFHARALAEHVGDCASCRAFVTELRQMSGEIAGLGREPASPGLKTRLRAALAAERGWPLPRFPFVAGWRGFTAQAASLAAVCLLSVFGTWTVMRAPDAIGGIQHDAVAAHVRSLLQDSPIQIPSSDTHTVRPWFNGKVEFAPPVRDLTADGFPLIGGRLDYIDGRRVAALVYHRRLHVISVFIWPAHQAPTPALSQTSGLNVLSWGKDGMVWWAVSDLSPEELRELRALL